MRRKVLLIIGLFGIVLSAIAQKLTSPDGNLTMDFHLTADKSPVYSLTYKGKTVIKESRMGFLVRPSYDFSSNFRIVETEEDASDTTWNTVWGQNSVVRDNHKELFVALEQENTGWKFNIRFRIFDDGLGFRYEFPVQKELRHFSLNEEVTEFQLAGDYKAFWIPADYDTNEFQITTSKLSEIPSLIDEARNEALACKSSTPNLAVQTPLMLKSDDGLYINIHEAALVNYPAMHLNLDAETFLMSAHLTPDKNGVKGYIQTGSVTPWRTIIVSDDARDILASNIIINLNEPCKIEDTSWIKPTKYVGVWWEMITGKKSSGGAASAAGDMNSVADSADKAGAAMGGAGSAAKKAAKDIKTATTGIDELNILNPDTGSGSGSGGAGGYDVDDFDMGSIDTSAMDEMDSKYQKLIDKAKELKDLFVKGFWDGFGDTSVFDSIAKSIDSIKNSLKEIFLDPEVIAAAEGFADAVAYNLGRIAGSVASIGATIADNLLGGIAIFLEQNTDRIKDYLISMFDIGAEIATIAGDYSSAIAEIFTAFRSDSAKQLTANLIGIFYDTFMGITEIGAKFSRDILDVLTRPFIDNQGQFKSAIEGFLGPLAEITGVIKDVIDNTMDKLNETYDANIRPVFDAIAGGLSSIAGVFLDAFQNHIQQRDRLPVDRGQNRIAPSLPSERHRLRTGCQNHAGQTQQNRQCFSHFHLPFSISLILSRSSAARSNSRASAASIISRSSSEITSVTSACESGRFCRRAGISFFFPRPPAV